MSSGHAICYLADGCDETWLPTPAGLTPAEVPEGAPLIAVVDSADEAHVITSMPAVRGANATRLLRRRLEREFPNTQLRLAQRLRRRREHGATDVVLNAVMADAALEARLTELGAHYALRALTTPSLLVAAWLQRARLRPHRLLVVLPTPAGLRLVFIEDGLPSLSRLMPPVDATGTATEIARTIQYLQNTQRIDRNEPLEIWCWGLAAEQVDACLPPGVSHVLGAAPQIRGLPDPGRDGWRALLRAASDRAPGVQLLADDLRLGWFAHEAGRWSRRLAIATLLAAVAGSAVFQWRAQGWQQEAAQVQAGTSTISSSLAELEAELAGRGLLLQDVRVVPDVEDALRGTEARLTEVFGMVGRAFGAERALRLATLELRSAPVSALARPPQFGCEGQDLSAVPAAQVVFGVADGLDIRARAAALRGLRERLSQVSPWQPTLSTVRIGAQDDVRVAAGADNPLYATEWTACLQRGDGA